MNASGFLLELLSEEIPARMQAGARAELEALFRREMDAAGVSVGDLTVYSTPRRLALIARDLPTETEAVREEAKGPPEGAPDQAVDGFCRKNGVTRDQLEVRDVKGRNTYFAVIEKPGRTVKDLLAEAIPAIIRDFAWPKSMRWGDASISTESTRWVRPLSGIVALLGNEVVECSAGDVSSGNTTVGHRFHSDGVITIGSADDYADKLRAAHVIVDHEERQDAVRAGAKKAAEEAGLTLVEDEGLVIENAGLTEWPVPLLGCFDEEFLDVPPEVIQLTARVNQKYFVCEDASGKLANAFVCTANIMADDPAVVVDGNRKVLAARLSDARFFWELDQKTPLAEHAKKLERITFHEKLGTVADKVERVAKLARWLCEEGTVKADPDLAEQAARLCKADLVTEMVGEFPELQGLMGGYYAEKEDLPQEVSDAIRDHYKPVGQGDEIPTAPVTAAVSLADKLDTLRSFFSIDEKPTGSKDPFALRRAALGVIRTIEQNGLRFGVAEGDLLDFFADRLKVQQREAGVRHDLIDAVFALGGEDDLVRLLARVKALQSFIETEDGANLLAGYKRAANILKKEEFEPTEVSYTPEDAEQDLIGKLEFLESAARGAIVNEDFDFAMRLLASLRAPIDRFFEDVIVNAEEKHVRAARLTLLSRFRDAVHQVADFSRIEG
ncbi:glycine--tRNA ligase subunit beta [Altererythrobacter sp.]|uniref:glycine--tRNA ligase subunit beta n=1 Tax=Altererythrobacter sp. TaxID=1872480 RepID=UPI001B2E885F|nr:glycine--tRNA ligase subunit beta [Altererythrobacter sp.]MBO6609110.1 glycine--tRNA ligase subunit beta [Altererythrobacter sp.]MBO6641363.1 glycine--tRNA ligase subunit beta [Altererythrobacter sp.]MBO6707939.1 glycine--tRNA ligase subunit beta [Altererythrobacter sp.]